jgi:predicted NUDIX family NTP pyrophosphohydrolase
MARHSAGLLVYRIRDGALEVFLAHPGGPFWARRDQGAWTIPKGLCEPNEEPLATARREFLEETGMAVDGEFHALGAFRQPGGKLVSLWAVEGDVDPARLVSNTFEIEWPPRSGRRREFPEIDRAAWFAVPEALEKVVKGQRPAIERLCALLSNGKTSLRMSQS